MKITILRSFSASFFLVSILFAQQPAKSPDKENPPAQPATTIVSHTQFVLVPVLVKDKSGKHIEHLTRDQFQIEENSKEQTISTFEEFHTVTVEPAKRPDKAEIYSNFASSDSRAYRATIIVLDLVNTPTLSQREGQKQLLKYLSSSLRSDEPTALFVLKRHGLRQVASLTTDPKILIAAVQQLKTEVDGRASVSDVLTSDAKDIDNPLGQLKSALEVRAEMHEAAVSQREAVATTLESLHALAAVYASIPGRKTLIWVTSGFPFTIDDPHSFQGIGAELVPAYEDTWRQLTASNIAVYPVNADGIVDPHFLAGGDMDLKRGRMIHPASPQALWRRTPYDAHEERSATLRSFAAATGGRPCIETNDLAKCSATAIDDSSAYYILGYYLKADDRVPGWRNLKVKVSAPDARVNARKGFYVSPPVKDPVEQQRRLLNSALHSPVEFTGVHFAVQSLPPTPDGRPADNGKLRGQFLVHISPRSIAINRRTYEINLEIGLFAINEKDEAVGRVGRSLKANLKPDALSEIARNGISVTLDLEVPPGSYTVKAIVHDNLNDQIGTVNFPFEVNKRELMAPDSKPAESVHKLP